MKTRVISAIVALLILLSGVIFFNTFYANILVFFILMLMTHEIHKAFKMPFLYISAIPAVAVCFFDVQVAFNFGIYIALIYFIIFMIVVIVTKKHILFAHVTAVIMECLLISFGFGTVILIRERFGTPDFSGDALALILFSMALGWICDTFAFVFGRAFGKTKLAPDISHKKTVEGAVGGVISTAIFSVLYFIVYDLINEPISMFENLSITEYVVIAIIGFGGSIVGIFGDLIASYIKRECKLKDFGNIMPGHGGALDRIDSVLLTIPLTYVCFTALIEFSTK